MVDVRTAAAVSTAKSYNILMLDLHATTCSRAELENSATKSDSFLQYVLYDDNPYGRYAIPPEVLP